MPVYYTISHLPHTYYVETYIPIQCQLIKTSWVRNSFTLLESCNCINRSGNEQGIRKTDRYEHQIPFTSVGSDQFSHTRLSCSENKHEDLRLSNEITVNVSFRNDTFCDSSSANILHKFRQTTYQQTLCVWTVCQLWWDSAFCKIRYGKCRQAVSSDTTKRDRVHVYASRFTCTFCTFLTHILHARTRDETGESHIHRVHHPNVSVPMISRKNYLSPQLNVARRFYEKCATQNLI
jgi:hypothetical protein